MKMYGIIPPMLFALRPRAPPLRSSYLHQNNNKSKWLSNSLQETDFFEISLVILITVNSVKI
jgi:hypothetical protein